MPLFCATVLPAIEKRLHVETPTEIGLFRPVPCKLEFYFDKTDRDVTCDAQAVYGERRYPLLDSPARDEAGPPPARLFDVSSVAEDWNGLEDLLLSTKPSYYTAALDIIRRFGIFSGREKQLMNLQGGIPYKDMLKRLFPLLRRIEFVVEYRIRALNAGEASEMIYTHPDLLSLEEMYSVARYYRPGTEQYREVYEVAAFPFPDD